MSDAMSVEKAIQTLKEIAEAKRHGTSRPDAELAKTVAEAASVVQNAAPPPQPPQPPPQEADLARLAREAVEAALAKQREPLVAPRAGFTTWDGNRSLRGAYEALIRKSAGQDAWLRRFHEWNDDVLLASAALGWTPERVVKSIPEFRAFLEDELSKGTSDLAKAMAAATSGAGLEWIPTVFSPELIDLIRVERVLIQAFRRYPMAAGTVRLSQLVREFSAFVVTESTGNTPYAIPAIVSDAGTGNVILSAVELAVAAIYSRTFEEDSIIPVIPEIRRRVVEGMAKGIEDAIINGSVFTPHPDNDVATVSGHVATAWDGLRATAQGSAMTDLTKTVDLSGANMTVDNLLKLKLLQGRYGARDADSIFITSPQGLVKLLGLRDAAGSQLLLTVDRFGPRAVLLTGAVAQLFGSDVIVSELVKTNLNANGINPAPPATGDRTIIIRANKPAFIVGDRRALSVEADSAPLTRQRILVATERLIFRRVVPAPTAADAPVTIGRNIETA